MFDDFSRDHDKAIRLTQNIQANVRERENCLRNTQSTARVDQTYQDNGLKFCFVQIDGTLRGQLKQLSQEVEGLLRYISTYEKNGASMQMYV